MSAKSKPGPKPKYANAQERQLAFDRAHPDYERNWRLKAKYGITLADRDALDASQGGLCAICGRPPPVTNNPSTSILAIDHDHVTNKVRALLCVDCNLGLGRFGDDVDRLLAAILYLLKHGRGENQGFLLGETELLAAKSPDLAEGAWGSALDGDLRVDTLPILAIP